MARKVETIKLIGYLLDDEEKTKKILDGNQNIFKFLSRPKKELILLGFSETEARKIRSFIELSKRMFKETELERLSTPQDAAEYLYPIIQHLEQEELLVITLNGDNKLTNYKSLFKGCSNSLTVNIQEILHFSILNKAEKIIIAHNHPSGNPYPSQEDDEMTNRIKTACNIIGIPLLDHIIIGDNKYFSYSESPQKQRLVGTGEKTWI